MPCESTIDENFTVEGNSNPTRIKSPALVFDGKGTISVLTRLLDTLALACTNEMGGAAACTVTVAVAQFDPSVAVTVTDWAVAMLAAVAVKVAVEAAAAMETELGTESALALLLLRLIESPPAGAA